MSGAGTTTEVALRPWPAPVNQALSKEAIHSQIGQLAAERGHLRGITEKALHEEIATGKDAPKETTGQDEEDGEAATHEKKNEPTTIEKLEDIFRAKVDMVSALNVVAWNAAGALDLVALMLSRDPTKVLDNSFSAHFKAQNVPKGAFGVDRGTPPDRSDQHDESLRNAEDERRHQLVARGSSMDALDWATDNILKAATELETGVRKETKYWAEIMSISEKGWSIQRSRRGVRHAPFAVRYGHSEASDHFKARGLAPLRMDRDGSIILDPALALKPKVLRVRISDHGRVTGTSKLPSKGEVTELALENSIQLARDSFFEEDLYHEMCLESRQLVAYGVEIRDSAIHIVSPSLSNPATHRTIMIDCILREETSQGSHEQPLDWLAQNVAEALRFLLAHEHRMRRFQRSQLPHPLTQQKRTTRTPPLLRTLLSVFSHVNAVNSVSAYLAVLARTFSSAGIGCSLQVTGESSWKKLTTLIRESTRKDISAVDQLFEVFTKHLDGVVTLSLPSSSGAEPEVITIATRTYIGPPTFGAEHKVTIPPSMASVLNLSSDQKRDFKFSSSEGVTSYLDWILSLDLTHSLLLELYRGRATLQSKEPQITIGSKVGKRPIDKDVTIEVADGELRASLKHSSEHDSSGREGTFVWDGSNGQPTLQAMVKSWVG
ncbi:subunit 17 of mediator complex-domain-containing protein [Massariosphaeria phaeospora]|uniref:Mediator of RNA polymerase II transcription subunit 17 n=1 Tax=Massariosphaeria phaeospora TaxID=100035 RepID=A0A7C8M2Q4_9PLEO|nr:subunit 17 of mediator complex-domain-containing protein [Massariosphaeria phaeospora]